MNNKAIAMIVAVSMVVVAMSGALAMGSSDAAADEDEIYTNGTIQVDSTGATRELRVNEQEFAGYDYTLTWSVVALSNSGDTSKLDEKNWITVLTSTNAVSSTGPSISYNTGSSGTIGDNSPFTVDVSHESNAAVGVYSLSVSAGSGTTYLGVKCEIKVTVGGMEKTLASVYYIYTLTKVEQVGNDITLDSMSMTTNTVFGEYVEEGTTDLLGDIGNYYWYATGLPAGISMSETGYVSGVPLVATEADTPVKAMVVATDKNTGDAYEGELSITIAEYTQSITDHYFQIEMDGQAVASVTNGSSFAVVQGETVTLKTYEGTSPTGTAQNVQSVTAIASDGTVDMITSTSAGVYSLNSAGTGAYRIVINVDGTNTLSFYLFVTPSLDNISAGIIVNGN